MEIGGCGIHSLTMLLMNRYDHKVWMEVVSSMGQIFREPSRIRGVNIKSRFGHFNSLEPAPGRCAPFCGLVSSYASWRDIMLGCYTWWAMDTADPFVGEIETPASLLLPIQPVKIRVTFPSSAPNQTAEVHLSFPEKRTRTISNCGESSDSTGGGHSGAWMRYLIL